ncbi:hypothetical protein [Streptomyces sp. NPDC054804]
MNARFGMKRTVALGVTALVAAGIPGACRRCVYRLAVRVPQSDS